jgi:hypothetical protein
MPESALTPGGSACWPRKNGKTLALYRATIGEVRIEPDALVHLMCHPADLAKVRADLAAVLAADPSLRPVDLHVGAEAYRGSVLAFRDLDTLEAFKVASAGRAAS